MKKVNSMEIDYNISTHPSKYNGYWKPSGKISLYIQTMWKDVSNYHNNLNEDELIDKFTDNLIDIILIETICFYRSKSKIKVTNRCKPHCKVARIANYMEFPDCWDDIRKFYKSKL